MKTLVITLDTGEVLRTTATGRSVHQLLAGLDNAELVIATIHIEYEEDWMCDTVKLNLEELRREIRKNI